LSLFHKASLIAANPDFPVYYFVRSVVDWHQGDLDAFVADQVMAMKKSGGASVALIRMVSLVVI
jgi:hypothetical protein